MIIRRLSEGIRRQDWFTVMVEVVIVVVGVYVGIFIGDVAKEREVQREVNAALVVVHSQLIADLVQIDVVLESLIKNEIATNSLLEMLGQTEINLEAVDNLILDSIANNRTYFANRSGYQSMRDLGYLTKIKNRDLSLRLSNFYESILVRQDNAAKAMDSLNGYVQRESRDENWDRYGKKFLGDPVIAAVKIRNGFRTYWGGRNYYVTIVKRFVHPEMLKSIDAIDEYLKVQGTYQ